MSVSSFHHVILKVKIKVCYCYPCFQLYLLVSISQAYRIHFSPSQMVRLGGESALVAFGLPARVKQFSVS